MLFSFNAKRISSQRMLLTVALATSPRPALATAIHCNGAIHWHSAAGNGNRSGNPLRRRNPLALRGLHENRHSSAANLSKDSLNSAACFCFLVRVFFFFFFFFFFVPFFFKYFFT